jgi:iron uptake system EfeUOB component EfeO/EfeM
MNSIINSDMLKDYVKKFDKMSLQYSVMRKKLTEAIKIGDQEKVEQLMKEFREYRESNEKIMEEFNQIRTALKLKTGTGKA